MTIVIGFQRNPFLKLRSKSRILQYDNSIPMEPKRRHPHLLELNAFIFLRRMGEKYNKKLTLATIPASEWQTFSKQGFDFIWLMGVWKRSPGARQCALSDESLKNSYQQALPGWTSEDVIGSPYAIDEYRLDPGLGNDTDLATLKKNLNESGLGLILDYVPNHMALDNPRTESSPECFIEAHPQDFESNPQLFYKTSSGRYLAHGRDPYFLPWSDTVQVNYFSPKARAAAVEDLSQIAQVADGVRCDMAMLGLNRVFEDTWKNFLKQPKPEQEFWTEILGKIKASFPDLLFIAEAYWDLEWELQQFGFDFTYDKKLCDRLLHASPRDIRSHLQAEKAYQEKSLRFIENHDEKRASVAFGREKSFAAATIIATLPGLRFFHDGQMQGKTIQLPIQLGRTPLEKEDTSTSVFYEKLLAYANQSVFHNDTWQMLNISPAWDANGSYANLLAWCWQEKDQLKVIIVNYAGMSSQGRLFFPPGISLPKTFQLKDQFSNQDYERNAEEIIREGLYIDLAPWQSHWFELKIANAVGQEAIK